MSKHHINYKKIDTGHLAVTLTIFLPVFIETALSSFYGVIDMMMVGKYDADGLAAIGLTSNPLSIFLSLFQAINVGTTTLVAWNVGAKKMKEAQDIMKAIPNDAYVVAMCVEGKQMPSEGMGELIAARENSGKPRLCFVIGGSFGLADSVKARADMKLSMSKMTFPHHLARVMLIEQLYRGFKINEGSRYHK